MPSKAIPSGQCYRKKTGKRSSPFLEHYDRNLTKGKSKCCWKRGMPCEPYYNRERHFQYYVAKIGNPSSALSC